ncbi:anaphase promoting complex subunit CDC27 [Sporobolomyces salmoneus]|uniref:anaphase promoting complex subunit CDC27 n=1 Tax=Sporobolomyces salmoneus TaxID=183962 RepID=UPI00317CE8F0
MLTRPQPPQASASTFVQLPPPSSRASLLHSLAVTALGYSLETALFYAERLYALESLAEPSVYLLSTIHFRLEQYHQAAYLLRQSVTLNPTPSQGERKQNEEDLFGGASAADSKLNRNGGGTTTTLSSSSSRQTKPAIECSVRCARLYGQICTKLGRDKEGRLALFRITQPFNSLVSTSSDPLESTTPPLVPTVQIEEATVLELEMARLAKKGGENERAIQSYTKVLAKLPSCWEALETLCHLGAPPTDLDSLYPIRSRPSQVLPQSISSSSSSTAAPLLQSTTTTQSHLNRSHPPPLGPSLNSTINAPPFSFGRPRNGDMQETPLGYSTPAEPGQVGGGGFAKFYGAALGMGGAGLKGKGKEPWLMGGGGNGGGLPLRRTASGRYGDITESSIDEQSFDTSFYPSAPLFSAPLNTQVTRTSAAPSSSLFTPPTTTSNLPTATAPGVKRTRGGNVAPASSSLVTSNQDDETGVVGTRSKRVVRGVPGETAKSRRGGAHVTPAEPPATRRSSRLSRDAGSTNSLGSVVMVLSKSQSSSVNGPNPTLPKSANSRDKKRSKANIGPSVLSDAGSEPRSPHSQASSPVPSSPGGASATTVLPEIAARQEAEDWVTLILRGFAGAVIAQSKYENFKVVEAFGNLPIEQQRSARCLIMLARSHAESLNYEKAEKVFAQARALSPHSLESMDVYSTILWHRRSSTTLSLLSQELMLLSPSHPSSWIATGNTFSLNSDHATALKCFKRAVQLDQNCVYAYTLAGHECIMLEEWERGIGFFREAIRRDLLHYNAWFGLGNVYMKTGKYTLADFHFRRALEINPSNATLVCCVGSVLEKSRRYKEALETYERACLLAPESSLARFRRARMMVALGRHQLAEPDLLQLKSLAPLEPTVHYLLGKLYKSLGPSKRAQMLTAFTTAQDLEPRMASVIREQIERSAQEGMDVDASETGSVAL